MPLGVSRLELVLSSPASRLTLARICYQSLFPTLLMIPVWASLLAALLPPTSCVLCCRATVQFLCVQPCNSGDPRATHFKFTFYFRVILCHLLHLKKSWLSRLLSSVDLRAHCEPGEGNFFLCHSHAPFSPSHFSFRNSAAAAYTLIEILDEVLSSAR